MYWGKRRKSLKPFKQGEGPGIELKTWPLKKKSAQEKSDQAAPIHGGLGTM